VSRRALGKGLDAIFANLGTEVANPQTGTAVHEVELQKISPNPFQPRREFGADELKELADSIRLSGLIQPIFLRKHAAGYQIVSGERRFRAFQSLGRATIPALVREQVSDRDMRELAIVENVQRVQLNPLEEALAYEQLVNDLGLTHEQVAERVGKSRTGVTNTLRLLKLEPEVRDWVREGKLTAGHGRALLQFAGPAQVARARAVLESALNVREAEKKTDASRPQHASSPQDADTRAFLDEVRLLTGMKVSLKGGAAAGGKVRKGVLELHFAGGEDLANLVETLRRGSKGEL
jgi:ParB family chromosome partitioning protein